MKPEPLAQEIVFALKKRRMKLGVAESFTGGMLCEWLTQIPGASEVFCGGIVAYTEAVKHRTLGIPLALLSRYSAVSAPVAREMANRARMLLDCDVAVSTTGFAGPSGGTKEAPVGTVFLGLATPEMTRVRAYHLGHLNRHEIRRYACELVFTTLLRNIA